MSNINYSDGKFILQEGERGAVLLDVRNPFANRSRVHSHQFTEKGEVIFPLTEIVNAASAKIFRRTPKSLAELVTYLRIVARLLNKPQIHTVLRVGQWSPLDESLAEILPQFNPDNKLYCLSETRPLGKVPSVNFIFAEGGAYPLPEKFFDTIIFSADKLPPEILSAVKPRGKIYFAAQPWQIDEALRAQAQVLPLTDELALLELEISPQFRQELRKHTPQGKLAEKFSTITQVVAKMPAIVKKFGSLKKSSAFNEYIAEFIRAEKILAEIFPALPSETLKFNFNLLKEFLIDLRLGTDDKSKKIALARVNRQYEILSNDLSTSQEEFF